MSKQLLHLTIELDGSVRKAQDHAPLSVLDQQWQERYEKGAELAIISAPAPEDDKQRKLVNKTINRCMFNGQRYALWPLSGETNLYVGEVDPGVLMLRIDRNGKVHDQKKEAAARGERLTSPYATRMLAGRLFPGIELALVQVPGRMTEIEEFSVRDTLAALVWKGRRYRLVGATGGAKDGKFYFAEEKWETCLARQYQRWPEAAISYFGILVSECEKGLIETHARVKVVNDHELGTNDSRGWVSQSLFDQMKIDGGALYQFRLAFELAQAKGTFKVMPDEVAQHPDINADIVIPESAIKPSLSVLVGKVFEGPVVLGVRDVSRTDTKTKGSYTVLQHASWPVIDEEIIGQCLREIATLKNGFDTEEHRELLEQIGSANSDAGFYRVVEACLSADQDGSMSRHPHIHRGIKQLLAQWAYKMLTGGGMRMPGRMLVDDGYLAVEDGKVYAGSDWIPYHFCITDQPGDRNLCVRFPVRMAEDLLPMKSLPRETAIGLLIQRGLSFNLAKKLHATQLSLHGTYTLRADRAKTFGGDYDGDGIAVINSEQYPKFVEYRFGMKEQKQPEKGKHEREHSPWRNITTLAFKAMGNRVGVITNTMSSALAAGMPEFAYELVPELQSEIDSLKHNTQANMNRVTEIADKVGKPWWLTIDKKLKSVDELPKKLTPLSESDLVARMYNVLCPELMKMIGEAKPIAHFSWMFSGLAGGKRLTEGMLLECRRMNEFFGSTMCRISAWLGLRKDALTAAQAEVRAAKSGGDKVEIMTAYARLREAEANLEVAKRKHRVFSSEIRQAICVWGAGKPDEERMHWAAALNHVVSQGKGSGSILYHAFPQQFADAVAEQTGGERVLVDEAVENWKLVLNATKDILIRVNQDSTWISRYKRVEEKENAADGNVRIVRVWRRVNPEMPEIVAGEEDPEVYDLDNDNL